MRWRGSIPPASRSCPRVDGHLPHRAVPCTVDAMGIRTQRRGAPAASVRRGDDMTIDRRAMMTGLVSAGALVQANVPSEAATGPEINASVIATLEDRKSTRLNSSHLG